jgi:hypothetical protein
MESRVGKSVCCSAMFEKACCACEILASVEYKVVDGRGSRRTRLETDRLVEERTKDGFSKIEDSESSSEC